jgi:septation ring formation regulator EzrA
MSPKIGDREVQLQERLREVEDNFDRQMRARGFEPTQAELIALPGPLANLYAEREELRAELQNLKTDPLEARDSVE